MQLEFEISQQVAVGNNPVAIHFSDQTAQAFYISNGRLYEIDTTTPEGEWENRVFDSPTLANSDFDMEDFTLRSVATSDIYSSWLSKDRHRFAFYGDYVEFNDKGYVFIL